MKKMKREINEKLKDLNEEINEDRIKTKQEMHARLTEGLKAV